MALSFSTTERTAKPAETAPPGFEELLIALSTRFINLPVDGIDAGIVEAIGQLGEFAQVDRSFVYQYVDRDSGVIELTHEWCATGADPLPDALRKYQIGPQRWLETQLAAGEIVHLPDTSKMPAEAADLQRVYLEVGVGATMYVPMFRGDEFIGTLGFSCYRRTKVWPEESIALLRVVGEIIVNAIDRAQADRQLRRSEERYRSIVEDQIDFVVRFKTDGTHIFVNEAVCRHLERSAEEMYRSNVFDFIHPADVEKVRQKLAKLTIETPVATDEHRVQLSNGRVYWHEWIDRALFDPKGIVREYQSVGRDITGRKIAQQELEYRQKLETLLLSLTTQFINLDPDEVNAQLEDALREVGEFTGVDRSYIYLMNEVGNAAELAHIWSRDGMPPVAQEMRTLRAADFPWAVALLEMGEPVHVPSYDALPPGTGDFREALQAAQVKSYINVPMLHDGKLLGMLGFSNSTSAQSWSAESIGLLRLIGEVFVNALIRKQSAQALARSEERLSRTVDAVADGFYDWNIQTGELFVSDIWLLSRKLPVGDNHRHIDLWRDAVHPDCLAGVEAILQDHLDGKTDFYAAEYRTRIGDGTWRWSLGLGQVIERDADNKPTRMVGVDRDITKEVSNRERLAETELQLAHLARVSTMGEVVAGIAHEVNQPLHAAATFASACTRALESGDPDASYRAAKMVRKISAQMSRAAGIIRRLREFTRPQAIKMSKFDLNHLIRESAELLAYEARKKQIRLAFDLDASLPRVMGDRVRIQQVIVNLLRNAYESIDDLHGREPSITIRTQMAGGDIEMQVADNGAGIPDGKEVETLFEAFATTKDEGMGVGLAISRTIIQAHRGRIWGTANEMEGMTFSFILPVEARSKHTPTPTQESS